MKPCLNSTVVALGRQPELFIGIAERINLLAALDMGLLRAVVRFSHQLPAVSAGYFSVSERLSLEYPGYRVFRSIDCIVQRAT